MLFWLFFLLGLVFAQDEFEADVEVENQEVPEMEKIEIPVEDDEIPHIETPEQYTAPRLNVSKYFDTREAVTDKKFPVRIFLQNTADQNITDVIIYDNVPEFFKVVEGTNASAIFDVIQPGEFVNFTYEVVPIIAGLKLIEGCGVNFTYNGVRQHQEQGTLGELYIVQNKGFIAVSVEWAVCIILFLVCYLIYVIHRTRVQKKTEMKLRAQGILPKKENVKKEKKENKKEAKPKNE